MSEQPNSTPPGGSNRGPGDSSNFNWRPLALFGVAILILGIAILHPPGSAIKPKTYAEFKKLWDQGRVIKGDEKHPLKILTDESAYDATITGWLEPQTKATEPGTKMKRIVFQVSVDKSLQSEEIKDILGEDVRVIKADDQPSPSAASTKTPEIVRLGLGELRKAVALGQVVVDDSIEPLRLVGTMPGSSDAMICGVIEKPETPPTVLTDKEGKASEPEQFEVNVSMLLLPNELRSLVIRQNTIYHRINDYLKNAIFTFLPVLLLVVLFFFLFRQQMKSAGRGAHV